MNKHRHIFFIIILMMTFIVGLTYISFAFYSETSSESENIEINTVNNVLSITGYDSNEITLKPYESLKLEMIIESRNTYNSAYKLFVENNEDIKLDVLSTISNNIYAKEKQKVDIMVTNTINEEKNIKFSIKNNYLGREIKGHGEEIKN